MTTATGHTSNTTIHVLRSGRTLCGNPPGEPAVWPHGHVFVRMPPPHKPLPPVVNCAECIVRYQRELRE